MSNFAILQQIYGPGLLSESKDTSLYPPQTEFVVGDDDTVFTLSICPSVTFWFLSTVV